MVGARALLADQEAPVPAEGDAVGDVRTLDHGGDGVGIDGEPIPVELDSSDRDGPFPRRRVVDQPGQAREMERVLSTHVRGTFVRVRGDDMLEASRPADERRKRRVVKHEGRIVGGADCFGLHERLWARRPVRYSGRLGPCGVTAAERV